MKRLASECIRTRMRKRSTLNYTSYVGPFESCSCVPQVGRLPVSLRGTMANEKSLNETKHC